MPMGAPLVAAETEMSSSPSTTIATTRKEDVAGKSSWKTRFSPSEQREDSESGMSGNSLAQSRMQRFSKKGMTTAVHSLRRLLPKGKPPMPSTTSNSLSTQELMEEDAITAIPTIPNHTLSPRNNSPSNPQSPASLSDGGNKLKLHNKVDSTSSKKKDLFDWQDQMEQQRQRELLMQKQWVKERDGFCRRVDTYDGSIIGIDGNKPTYELGNYLGGGVAGVVYEGHRLRPIEDYPVRTGISESGGGGGFLGLHRHSTYPPSQKKAPVNVVEEPKQTGPTFMADDGTVVADLASSILCAGPITMTSNDEPTRKASSVAGNNRQTSVLSDAQSGRTTTSPTATPNRRRGQMASDSVAIETAADPSNRVMLVEDKLDAPSRSEHYAKAAATVLNKPRITSFTDTNTDTTTATTETASVSSLMEETVAIKILNPVGFRLMTPDVTQTCVIVREGERMDDEIKSSLKPMQEKHVWWLVHPNSRNLRTLQKDASKLRQSKSSSGYDVDRGSPDKGLRLSLLAAYVDPKTNKLRELPLTRCIEIWGHMPFAVSDNEFEDMMAAIDRVNAGLQPSPLPPFITSEQYPSEPPSRVATGGTESTNDSPAGLSVDELRVSNSVSSPFVFAAQRTGLYRVAYVQRQTVYCEDLHAYIGIPAVPSKYLRWLRQRRAATKEIRNMMLIGRHKNVVHLFEVLEYIQEAKSTMFLILELVRGGELFDLISSSSSKTKSVDETESMMRKFFQELASGIQYCHSNGIAHRDLKPENLLVHTAANGECTLKIADFGLSAAFGPNSQAISDQDTVMDSVASPHNVDNNDITSFASFTTRRNNNNVTEKPSPLKESINQIQALGSSALSLLTCGAMEDVLCNPSHHQVEEEQPASPLRRMTSVVGSPHYVAPEIISQRDDGSRSSKKKPSSSMSSGPVVSKQRSATAGYDGTKADVWSAGVILYAMLFRSLPFGEDLLRCPRFQSFRKWYDVARKQPGSRRASAFSALNPVITETEERDMLGPHWFFPSEASKESKDLIVAMLNPNPDDRLSIQMVMQHAWLRQGR